MASNYKVPGVYVEEISTLPASVAQVETAIPAFIGYTEKTENNGVSLLKVPTRITSMLEYESYFGSYPLQAGITVSITDYLPEGGGDFEKRTIVANDPATPNPNTMYYALQLYFANGGGPCYIVTVGDYSAPFSSAELGLGLDALEKEDEPTLILFPDAKAINDKAKFFGLYASALAQCNKLGDRFTVIDPFSMSANSIADIRTISSDYLKYGAAYYPFLKTTLSYNYLDAAVTIDHNEITPTTDPDTGEVTLATADGGMDGDTVASLKAANNELYFAVKSEISKLSIILPPGSAMAGVYARVDNDRGVWKAPANVTVSAVVEPVIKITNEEQGNMNIDATSGKSINAIRTFTGKGVLVWGARTLAGNDNEWRYVSVRRFFNMVEESVKKATEFVVFEPNDANTWVRTKAMIENYLTGLWRAGALAGAAPSDAFFVNVGIGTTMTPVDILEGRMNIEIGMAAVRPAEFIILKFSHKLQE